MAAHLRPGQLAGTEDDALPIRALQSVTRNAAQALARPHSAAEHLQAGQYEVQDHLARPRSASPVLFSRQIDRAAAGQEAHRERVGRTVGPGMHFLNGAPSDMYGEEVPVASVTTWAQEALSGVAHALPAIQSDIPQSACSDLGPNVGHDMLFLHGRLFLAHPKQHAAAAACLGHSKRF